MVEHKVVQMVEKTAAPMADQKEFGTVGSMVVWKDWKEAGTSADSMAATRVHIQWSERGGRIKVIRSFNRQIPQAGRGFAQWGEWFPLYHLKGRV